MRHSFSPPTRKQYEVLTVHAWNIKEEKLVLYPLYFVWKFFSGFHIQKAAGVEDIHLILAGWDYWTFIFALVEFN